MLAARPWLSGLLVVAACGGEPAERPTSETAERPSGAVGTTRTTPEIFVDAVPGDAQLVFVGVDSTLVPEQHSGATFVPLSTFSVERDGIPNEFPEPDAMQSALGAAGVSGVRRVVFVGNPIPAARAFAAFDYLGRAADAALLEGGVAQLPAQANGARAPEQRGSDASAPFDADVRDDMIVDADWVHARLGDESVAILDARPSAEYSGADPGDGIDRPGHIPGARNLFWQDLVVSADDTRLKPDDELRRLFAEAGADADDVVVAYCRTGGQASFLYAVARYLGYDVKLYDGSYIDWSRTQYPVER